MKKQTLEKDFLPVDVDRVRPRFGTTEVVSWTRGGAPFGSARVRSTSTPPGLILTFTVTKESVDHPSGAGEPPDDGGHLREQDGEHPNRAEAPSDRGVGVPFLGGLLTSQPGNLPKLDDQQPISAPHEVSHRLSLRTAALTFGTRTYFACPRCDRRVRVLFISRRIPSAAPVCRSCTGARYASEVHHRGHPIARGRRARRLIERAADLISRPRLRADRRARGLELLAQGERQLRDLLGDLAGHGLEVADQLAARLDDVRMPGWTA